jgi:type IV pilus assembly protein PilB
LKNIPIGEVLKDYGYINQQQLDEGLRYQHENPGERLGDVLVKLGFVTEQQREQALGQRMGLPVIDVDTINFDYEAVKLIPQQLAVKNRIIAFALSNGSLKAVTSDPLNLYGLEEIRQTAGMTLDIYIGEEKRILQAITDQYSEVDARKAAETANDSYTSEEIDNITIDDTANDDAPVIKLVQSLIIRGYNSGASDIHIEPFEDKSLVRMRIDGVITDYVTLQPSIHAPVIARIKIMSDLDIAEKRVPQDGHFRIKIDGQNVNIRVSVIPTVFGEKCVMRILASKSSIDYASHFGMNDKTFERFRPLLTSPNGIIYITGPTGSGKSTTLYMVLEAMSGRKLNISTIEDPVEKNIMRVNQMQVNNVAGLTFETGLRAILRQDPDVIMVGETRDAETASISVRAAITGHLVLSTLHTNDAVSSIVRLEDMGVEPYLVSSSVIGLIAQRLMRKVCQNCAEDVPTTPEERAFLGEEISHVKRGRGCPLCNNTGYSGRIAIHEVAVVDRKIRAMISRRATTDEMTEYVIKEQKMTTLKEAGIELVKAGITTMEELVKVAYHTM